MAKNPSEKVMPLSLDELNEMHRLIVKRLRTSIWDMDSESQMKEVLFLRAFRDKIAKAIGRALGAEPVSPGGPPGHLLERGGVRDDGAP